MALDLKPDEVAIIFSPNAYPILELPNEVLAKADDALEDHVALAIAITVRCGEDQEWINDLIHWLDKYVEEKSKTSVEAPSPKFVLEPVPSKKIEETLK